MEYPISQDNLLVLSVKIETLLNSKNATKGELSFYGNCLRLQSLIQSLDLGLVTKEQVEKSQFYQNMMSDILKPKKR